MTLWDLVRTLFRRWPVVLVGMVCTVAAGLYLARPQAVYFSQCQAVFLAPSSTRYPNPLQTRSEDLIITAGAVAKRIVGPAQQLKHADPSVNIIGIPDGDQGYWIRLPDTGGQWATHFQDQELLVDVAAPTETEARALQSQVFQRIQDELRQMQDEYHVKAVDRITVILAPAQPAIYEIRGSRVRALGMVFALGLVATVGVVMGLEVRQRRRPIGDGGVDETDRAKIVGT